MMCLHVGDNIGCWLDDEFQREEKRKKNKSPNKLLLQRQQHKPTFDSLCVVYLLVWPWLQYHSNNNWIESMKRKCFANFFWPSLTFRFECCRFYLSYCMNSSGTYHCEHSVNANKLHHGYVCWSKTTTTNRKRSDDKLYRSVHSHLMTS